MEMPTYTSSKPDRMGRTVCFIDENARRARYGRIHPMVHGSEPLLRKLGRFLVDV